MVQTGSSADISDAAVRHCALTGSVVLLDPATGKAKTKQTKRYTVNSLHFETLHGKKKINNGFILFSFKNKCTREKKKG